MSSPILEAIITKPAPLSKDQKQAVLSEEKYIRIIAGAGTGKTETLTRRIIYLLLYHNIEPKDIVAFTFTEKAAQSMKSRIYQRVKELKGEEICAKLGEMYVGTIHGYCLKILQDFLGYGDHDVLDENQEIAFLIRKGREIGLYKGGKYTENWQNFIKSVNVIYDELIDRDRLEVKAPVFYKQLKKYEALLDKHRLLTFGRMIAIAVERIKEKPEKISHIKHLIVDEYQDINRAQERLIALIGKNANIFIVGDPRQSIYQWRGSNVKCFDNFTKLFKNVKTFMLRENRRSVKQIVDVANTFADTFDIRFEYINSTRKEKGIILQAEFETPAEEAEWITDRIREQVNRGSCKYNDCAILLRSVITSVEPFIEKLKKHNIPYVVGGKVGLFRRDEAQAMGRLFSWLWDDGFWVENPWNWRKKTQGDKLLGTGIECWTNAIKRKLGSNIRLKLKKWKKKVLNGEFKNFTDIFHELLIILDFKELNPDNKNDAPIMANLGRFSTLLADYESSIRLGGNKPDWRDAIKGLCLYMNVYATSAYEEQPSDDIRGIDAVQIMTVHQAKGLEWPIVFIPCMVKRRFPSSRVGYKQDWLVPRSMFDVKRYEGNIEDEKRLFYVAITRARDILCISWFKKINKKTGKSQFLSNIAPKLKHIKLANNIPVIEISPPLLEDEIETFAVGEILTYIKCPYFYRLRELWNYKPGLVEALGYGKSLHYCLRCVSELIINNEMDIQSAVKKIINEKFHVPYASSKAKEKMKNEAIEVLSKFVQEHKEDIGKIEEIEARIEFPVQKATITGRVDVILKNDKSMEVRDYKTSDEVTTFDQTALQVQLYSLGLNMIGKPITRASIAYLENAELKYVTINSSALEDAKRKAEECIRNILNRQFKPSPKNRYCINCDQKKICKYNKNKKHKR